MVTIFDESFFYEMKGGRNAVVPSAEYGVVSETTTVFQTCDKEKPS
jgi:hypothetical protein